MHFLSAHFDCSPFCHRDIKSVIDCICISVILQTWTVNLGPHRKCSNWAPQFLRPALRFTSKIRDGSISDFYQFDKTIISARYGAFNPELHNPIQILHVSAPLVSLEHGLEFGFFFSRPPGNPVKKAKLFTKHVAVVARRTHRVSTF